MKKIVFLGAKQVGYECLSFLIDKRKELDMELGGVWANTKHVFSSEYDFAALCKENNIPLFNSLDELNSVNDIDILISIQYNEILQKQHIEKAKQIAVNLHMAPLPEYRGSNQFSFAILDGAKEFGVTLHRLEERVDAGDILFEKRFPVPANCWVKDLYGMTYGASIALFKEHLEDIVKGNYRLIPQESLIKERGNSFHRKDEISKIKVIDLNWDKEKIERHIRATYFPPFEPPYALVDGKKIYFNLSSGINKKLKNYD